MTNAVREIVYTIKHKKLINTTFNVVAVIIIIMRKYKVKINISHIFSSFS